MNSNNVAIAKMVANEENMSQEALGQNKWFRFTNWTKTKAFPWMKEKAKKVDSAVKNIDIKLPRIRISWVTILAVIILATMAKNGMLDEMPNLKWLLETTIRMVEWLIGVVRSLLEWVIELPTPKFFGIGEMFQDWMRNMFAI